MTTSLLSAGLSSARHRGGLGGRIYGRVSRLHPNDCHHSSILMVENMAMVDEVAHVRPAEIHPQSYTRIRTGPGPIRNIHCVEELLLFPLQRMPIHRHRQKVNLVNVKFMVLQRVILDRPVFH